MAEILLLISLISFIAAGVCFVLAVFFYIKFKIPAVIGDLSGRTAKKSIEKMRENNERTGNKSYRSSSVNVNRGKVTESMPLTEDVTMPLVDKDATVLLNDSDPVDFQKEYETESLLDETVLMEKSGGMNLEILEEVILIHTEEVIR